MSWLETEREHPGHDESAHEYGAEHLCPACPQVWCDVCGRWWRLDGAHARWALAKSG